MDRCLRHPFILDDAVGMARRSVERVVVSKEKRFIEQHGAPKGVEVACLHKKAQAVVWLVCKDAQRATWCIPPHLCQGIPAPNEWKELLPGLSSAWVIPSPYAAYTRAGSRVGLARPLFPDMPFVGAGGCPLVPERARQFKPGRNTGSVETTAGTVMGGDSIGKRAFPQCGSLGAQVKALAMT
ncbi:hypothetical protein C8034_v006105 [Colletotrichum sidae]|uniref:Uncharacterized protein n=1 Tax=Colletotrichum sidae TaxID=1347389 RepID=A0A4R8TT95_9PEZI|nr:hypothetical protein C8034_v006105 [Colletotrichum sidae]